MGYRWDHDPCTETAPMPKPIPVPLRQKLWERARRGETTASLARAYDLSPRTVPHSLKRLRDRGPAALSPDYRPPTRLPQAYPADVRRAALALRRDHPTWGATLRTAQPRRRPRRVADRASRPQQTWPMDAC